MDIDDMPNLKQTQFPERITIAVSTETKQKLEALKSKKKKDTSWLLRKAIDEVLKDVAV